MYNILGLNAETGNWDNLVNGFATAGYARFIMNRIEDNLRGYTHYIVTQLNADDLLCYNVEF